MTLTYDEPVQHAAGTSSWPFEYVIDTGDATTVCSGHVDGRTVTLALCEAATAGQTVTLRYEPVPPAAHLEDLAGNDVPVFAAMTIDNVTNATAATITGIQITSDPNGDLRMGDDGTYAIGDPVDVTVTFDRTITVNTAAGTPELELDIGGTPVPALYSSGSTSSELVFTYTVAKGDEDTDGIAIGANKLSANGGIIASNGKNADLAHLAQPANAAHKVDGVRPTMTNAVSSADGTTIVVTFSEPMSSSTTTYTLYDGDVLVGDNGVNSADVTDNTVTLTLNIALTHGESLDLKAGTLTARDAAGNTTAEHTQAITDGVTAPAAYLTAIEVSSTPGDDGTYVSQDTVRFTAAFNNTVTVTGTPQLKFNLGGTANEGHRNADYASGSPGTELVFEYTVLATDESTADGIGVRSDPINLNAGDITRNGNTVQLYRRSRGGDGTHRVNYAPPVFASAATASDGMSIVLTFDQTLKGSTISKDHFSVTVDGETASLSGRHATISGATVTLSLTDTLIGANTVTVRYTDPTDGDDVSAIQDLLGNDAASFTAEMVTNTVVANTPDAPTGLTATTTRTRDVTLDWTAPSDTGSTAISGYRIEVSTDSGVNWEVLVSDTGSTDTSYKHEGLTPNTRYDYRVSAINADGAGTASGTINTTTAVETTISTIVITSDPDSAGTMQDDDYYQGINAPGSQQDDIKVTVTFSAAVDVQAPTTSKAIALEIAGQTKLAAYSSGSGTTKLVYQYTVEEGLEDRDGVSFEANPLRGGGIVTKDKGSGFEADLSHAAIADDDAHKVDSIRPTILYAEAAADRESFTLIFNEPVTNLTAALVITPLTGTVLRHIQSTVVITGNIATLNNPYPFIDPTSTLGVDTDFDDVADNRPLSAVKVNYPFASAATPPSAPQNLTALPGNGRVTLTWDAPDSDGGRPIDSYESRYSSDGGDNWSDWTEIPDSGLGGMNRSRYRVMGLTNGTTYTLELRAVTTADGDGAAAQTTGMPREPGAIGVEIAIDPTSPVAEDVGTVTVTVTAANTEATVPEAGVTITVSTANGTATAGEDFEGFSETVTFAIEDFALAAGTHWEASEDLTLTITDDDVDEDDETFVIKLAASGDSASEVSLGAGITVTITDDDEVPGAPSLSAEAGDAEVTLKWTAPTNPGTSTIDGYDYRVGDAAMTWDPDWTAVPDSGAGGGNASSYTVTMYAGSTLANGTSYTFEVRARSAAGEGPEAQATTTPGEVCGRTKEIADAIVSEASVTACGDVTTAHLAAITQLTKTGGNILALKSGDFAGLSAMTKLNVSENNIGTLPADIFAGLSQLEELELAESSFTGGTLPPGIFSGLTGLRLLNLFDVVLRTLRGDEFAGLSALEELNLGSNQLTALPAGVFTGLTALEELKISSNQLSALPAGLLSGLTNLRQFWSQDNTVRPLPFTVTLEKVGEDGFRARVLQGAPFDIELPLTITGGTIDSSATSLTVSKGTVESATLEVTRTAESTDAVSVDIGPLPGLPTDHDSIGRPDHRGYALTKSDDLPLDVVPALMSTAVTLSVDPAEVAEDAGETTLTVTGTLDGAVRSEETVVTLSVEAGTASATDDYSTGAAPTLTIAIGDQTAMATLTLTPVDDNATEDGETVTIGGTVTGGSLTVTAVEVTITDNDELPGAPTLSTEAGDQEVTLKWTAPANAGTSTIDGYDYRVSDDAAVTWDPDWTAIANSGAGGANAGSYTVTMHGGATLLNGTAYTFEVRARSAAGGGPEAQATTTPGEVCGRTKEIADAIVAEVSVTACGDVTTAHLAAITELTKTGGDIQALKSGDFAGLSALTKLNLSNNVIQTLPTDIFADVSQLEELNLNESSFTGGTLPQGVFSGLSALRELKLGDCELQTLPENLFSGLSALEYLSLFSNYLSELPPGLFGGLSALETVFISQNRLSGVPEGLLSGLTNLVKFKSEANNVDPLPFTVTLEKVGEDGFRARVLQGAPFDIELPLSITGGTIDGGTTSLTVSKGSVESTTLEVTRPDGSTEAVVVDIGTLPDLPTDFDPNLGATFGRYHQGYALAKSDDLPLEVLPQPDSTTIELTVEPTQVDEDAGATTLTVTAMLNAAVRTDATVVTLIVGASGDSATATTDYTTAAVTTLTIAAEERSGSKTFTLTPVDDTDGEGDETVTIGGTVTVETLTVNGTEVTIIDDDATPVPVTLTLTSDPDTSGPDDDTYAIGNVIEATATFSGTVTVTGTPQLELDIGGKPRLADCALATDTTKLACTYTVAEGDEDTDGIAIEANKITLNGAVITLGTDAVTPTHDAVTDASAHLVDGVRPKLTDTATSADGTKVVLTYDQTLSATTAATGAFTVTVSSANIEATTPSISAVAASDETVTVTIGTAVKAGQTVTVDYADPNAGDDANAVQDAPGNDAASIAGQAVTNTVPEDATVSALSVALSSATVTEGGDAVTVTVTIAASATFATDRSVALAWGGEALAPNAGLIREPSGRSEVLIAAGESSATATLTGVERAAYTVATTRTLTATFDDADETAIGTGLDLTYMDSGSAPAASISATPAMVPEGDDITVEVTLTRAFDIDVAVTLTMADTEGVVSGTPPTSIAIVANETTGTVTLSTTADMMTGADASVVFTLGDATNEPYSLGTPATVTVTVLDDTSASDEITLSVAPATVDEDATETALSVTATLNRAARTTATDVALSIAGGTATEITDFRATTVTLTIAANAQSGSAPLTLTPVNDTSIEPDETVTIEGTATGFTVRGAQVTILDDDEPAITLSFVPDTTLREIDEDAGPLAVGLTATTTGGTAPTRDIVVKVETVLILSGPEATPQASPEEGDFKPFEGNYTFAAADFTLTSGQWMLTVSNDLELIDDSTVEKVESFELHVDQSTLASHVTAPPKVLVQINNEDTATVRVATDGYQVEEGEELVLQVVTSAPVDFPFTVIITTAELGANFNTDQIVEELRTTFSARLANVEAYATANDDYVHRTEVIEVLAYEDFETRVQSIEDTVDEADETFLMRLVGHGLDPSLTITPNYAFVTIIDDDQVADAPTGLTVDNAGPTRVTLSWTAPSNEGSHTITGYLVERSTDSDPSLRPRGTNELATYTETGLTPETTYHYRVSAITAAGRSEPSETVSATTAALPVIDISADTVSPMQGTSVFESRAAIFRVTRAGDRSEAITVNVEWTQDDSAVTEDTLDIGAESVFGVYVVGARDNAVDEPDGSITVTLKAGTGYTLGTDVSETVIVLDDDEAPGAPVLSARPDNEQIELTWPKPAPGTSDITRYDYRRSDNNGVTWSDWTDTSVDLAQTMFSLTFENLVNGTLYSFDVRAVSDAGESEPSNIATATPSTGPTISAIEILSTPSLCDGRAYAQSEEVRIGVTFSEAVSVDTTGGQPYLSLRMEDYDANAPYKEGSGTTQLVFARTVVVSDWSGRGKSFAVDDPGAQSGRGLQLNGATIRSTANGNTAVLTGRSLGRIDNAHMIGVVMTGTTMTSSPALEETYAKGERLTLTADFNAPIGTHNGANSKLVLAFDSGPREAEYSHYNLNKVHYGYTITEGDADANGVGIPKDALNLNGALFGVPGVAFNYVPCNAAIEALSTDKVDAAGPTLLTSAPNEPQTSVDGTKVVLHFDEMVSMTTAEPGAFTVTVDGTERGIDTVMADGVQVWLMLASAVATGEPVTVSYTDPSSDDDDGAIQDKLSNDAGSFANQAVTNKVPASGAPGKPTGVTATATPTTITVSWTAPTDPGTTALTGYAVEWATNENGPWSTATADTGSTTASYTHTGQTPETTYHYRVAAINGSGAGERSDSTSATTPAAPVMTIEPGTSGENSKTEGAPVPFTVNRAGNTDETLTVKLNVTQTGEVLSASTQSTVQAVAGDEQTPYQAYTDDDSVDEPDGSITVELLPGTGYTLGDATSATITVTDDDDPPGAPTLAVTPGNAQAALAWTAPSDTGSETISGYDYRVSDDATVTWDPDWTAIADSAPGETNAASYTVSTGLTNGTPYTFELRARNAIGAGPPSAQITITPSTTVNNAPAFPATETGMRTVVENTAAETAIGAAVAASDPDTADTVTYSLGGADASHFTIVSTSGQLKVGSSAFDYEAPADADGNNRYQVTVTASDGNGASAVLPVTVEVTDAASVKSVAITSTPADYHSSGIIYTTGETIEVTVTFSEAVTVDTAGGTPSIGIDVGGAKSATYKSGSGTAALVFGYDIVSSDTEQGGVSITANTLALNSGTIKDADNNNAELGHGGLARDGNHRVGDMVRPVGFSLDEVPASNVYGEGVTLRLLGEFSRAVFVNGNNWSGVTIKMRIGGLTRTLRASGRTGMGNKFVIFDSYAIALNEVDNDGIEVLANTLAGPLRYGSQLHPFLGHGAWASDAAVRVDGVYPRLAGANPAVTSSDGTKIILTFTEAVSQTTAAPTDFTVTVSGMTRTVSAVEASDKTVVLTLSSAVAAGETITVSYTDPSNANDENAIQDIGGNDLESFSALAVTNLGPTGVTVTSVDLTSAAGTDETYAIGDVVTATVTLSEAVSLTGTPQLELDVGAAPKTADCALAADTTKLECTYTIVADDEATDGIAIGANKLTLNDASISKASGDPGGVILAHSAKTADTNHKVDGVRPTPTRASADGTALTLVWSEPLNTGSTPAGTAFTVGVNSGTAPMVSSVAISASTATLTLSAAVDTTKTYTLAYAVPMTNPIEDAVGNPAVGFTGESVSTIVLTWTFTVMSDTTENGNPVIVEGGDSATVTATITNPGYTPPSNVPVTLQWDGTDIGGSDEPGSLLSGSGGVNTITVLAGETSGTLIVSKSNDDLFSPTQTAALTATHPGGQIGSVDVTLKDDDDPPVLTIGVTPTTITEGETARMTARLNRGYASSQSAQAISVVAPSGTLTAGSFGTTSDVPYFLFVVGQEVGEQPIDTDNDSTAEDAAEVVFTIIENADLYTVGTPASVTLTVLDNDTVPSEPQNIEAEPNYTVVALTWGDPAEDGGQTITKYEYRYSDDSRTTWGPGPGPLGWADVPMSDVGEVNRNGYTVTGLVNGTTHSFEVRAVNVAGGGTAATIDATPIDPTWAFTVTPSSTDSQGDRVASITEGGSAITARAAITNTVRFDDPVEVTLEWGGSSLSGALEGAGGTSIITIAANGDSATLEITAPQDPANAPFYLPTATEALTATVGTVEIGSVALTRTDDEPKPSVTLEASTTKLTEGGNITLTATRTIASVEQSIPLATTDTDTALTGTIPTAIVIANADTEASVTVNTGENTDMDGARTVTFTLGANADAPHYTLGDPKAIDVTVLDDDTPPGTPQSFTATGGYKKVALAWQEPLSDGGQGVEHYEYRYSDDGEMTWEPGTAANDGWAMVPDSGEGETNRNGLVIDPLMAGIPYDFELRAHNTAGAGGVASDSATPVVPEWAFTVRGATTDTHGNAIAEIVEGGASIIAVLTITNDVRFPTEEIVDITWGSAKLDVSGSHVTGAGGATTITMPIGSAEATLAISAPDLDATPGSTLYHPPQAQALTATHDNTAIDSVTLTRIDGVGPPTVIIRPASNRVSEGEGAEITLRMTPTVAVAFAVNIEISDPGSALASTPATIRNFVANQIGQAINLTTSDNMAQDPTRTVTIEVKAHADYPWYSPGDPSTATLTVLDNDTPPPAPPGFKAKGENAQATLTWNAPPASSGGRQPIERYEVRWKETSASAYTVMWTSVGTARTYTVQSLTNKTPYTFQVRAENVAGYGPSSTTTATPSEVSVPTVPQNVQGTGGLRYARFTWEAPESDGNSPILRYEYSAVPIHHPGLNPWIRIGLTHELEFNPARSGTHRFWLRAVNAIGPGPVSEKVTAYSSQSDTSTPSEPQGLSIDTDNSSRAKLKWRAPGSPGNSPVTGYRIEVCQERCDDETSWTVLVADTGGRGVRWTHEGLAPGVIRKNIYRVKAINSARGAGEATMGRLPPTEVWAFSAAWSNHSTVALRISVDTPDGMPIYVRYWKAGDWSTLKHKQYLPLVDGGVSPYPSFGDLSASTTYRVEMDFVDSFDSPRKQGTTVTTPQEGTRRENRSPYQVPEAGVDIDVNGDGVHDENGQIRIAMGDSGTYRLRLRPCEGRRTVHTTTLRSPAGALQGTTPATAAPTQMALACAGTEPGAWQTVTVTARAVGSYPEGARLTALLSAPLKVVYSHDVYIDTESGDGEGLVSSGTGTTNVQITSDPSATIAAPTGLSSELVANRPRTVRFTWDQVPEATGYYIKWGNQYQWRHGTETGLTLSFAQPVTWDIKVRVRAFNASNVSPWAEIRRRGTDSPTLYVDDTEAHEETHAKMRFRVRLAPAALWEVKVTYATVNDTAIAGSDYTATWGTLTFAAGETEKTVSVAVIDDTQADSGERFKLRLQSLHGQTLKAGIGRRDGYGTIRNTEELGARFARSRFASTSHAGAGSQAQVAVAFSEAVAAFAKTTPSVTVTGGRVASVRRHAEAGLTHTWMFFIEPSGTEAVTFTLASDQACDAGGICTEDGRVLKEVPGARTLPGPDEAPVIEDIETFTVAENTTHVARLGAGDADTAVESLTWSIPDGAAGGADGAAFTITGDGVLAFAAAKDFEAPDDAGADGVYEVTVRVGDGTSDSEAALRVRVSDVDDTAPALTSAEIDADALTLTFDEALDTTAKPATSTFAVTVNEETRTVESVTVADRKVTLTLASAVVSADTVSVAYAAPADPDARRLRDAAGNAAGDIAERTVTNATPVPGNEPPTGAPTISGTAQVDETLTVSVDGIDDPDGMGEGGFSYRWLVNDRSTESEIAGATAATYTPVAADTGKTLRVEAVFTDAKGRARRW